MEIIPSNIIAVDWGKNVRKRAAYLAEVATAQVTRLLFDGTLENLIQLAGDLEQPVLIGIDAAIGFPEGAWKQLIDNHHVAENNFIDFLLGSSLPIDFFDSISQPDDWSPARPFISPPKKWSRGDFEEAANGCFYRHVDSRLKGNSIFITSGMPGTVGSGTRALWQELIALSKASEVSIWPFHGSLESLLSNNLPVIAEIYPKACYGLALSETLPAPLLSLGKTKLHVRQDAIALLLNTDWMRDSQIELHNLDAAEENEDNFDAMISAISLLRLFLQRASMETKFSVDPTIEGGVLGAANISISLNRIPPSSSTRPTKSIKLNKKASTKSYPCPIEECNKIFFNSRGGWDAHVAAMKRHPNWHPDVTNALERHQLFRDEFPEWFREHLNL